MGSKPMFSIVMPTRDRAHLLQYALQSALAQTFDDYEILVSDNSSTDNTREVVCDLADERVRYVCTEKRLSMPDNWEFALEHARGDHITYLCDDDAMGPMLLQKLQGILSDEPDASVGWKGGLYIHPDWPEAEARNRLSFPGRATGEVLELDSTALLEKMFALEYHEHYPRLLNSCCPRNLLEQRRRRMGRLFFPTCPDYSAAVATLTGIDQVLFVDEFLVAFGWAGASNGSYGFAGSAAIQTFMSEFSDLDKIWRIPLSSTTAYNQIAVTLIGLKDVLDKELAPYSLSIPNLFVQDRKELELMLARGADASEMLKDWDQALAAQSADTQREVRELVSMSSFVRKLQEIQQMRSRGADVSHMVEDWERDLSAQGVEVQKSVRETLEFAPPNSTSNRLRDRIQKRFPIVARTVGSAMNLVTERKASEEGPAEYRFDDIFEATKALETLSESYGESFTSPRV